MPGDAPVLTPSSPFWGDLDQARVLKIAVISNQIKSAYDPRTGNMRHVIAPLLSVAALAPLSAADTKPAPKQRGIVKAEETCPKHFPHRIWAACDFEGQTPDYAWFGPPEMKNIPRYPGNGTALGVKE